MAGGPSLENIFSDLSHARIIELLRAQENSSEYSVSNLPPVKPKAGDVCFCSFREKRMWYVYQLISFLLLIFR